MRSRIGARGEVQVVSSGRITLGVEVEDVSVERRAITEIEVGVRVSDVIEDHRSVGAGPRNTQRMHDSRANSRRLECRRWEERLCRTDCH